MSMDEVLRSTTSPPGTAPIGGRVVNIQGVAGGTAIPVSVAGGTPNPSAFYTAQSTVAVSGTAVQLGAQAIATGQRLTIKAKNTNAGRIRVGNSAANAQNAALAFTLGANEAISLQVDNANKIWVDATVNGDGVELISEV